MSTLSSRRNRKRKALPAMLTVKEKISEQQKLSITAFLALSDPLPYAETFRKSLFWAPGVSPSVQQFQWLKLFTRWTLWLELCTAPSEDMLSQKNIEKAAHFWGNGVAAAGKRPGKGDHTENAGRLHEFLQMIGGFGGRPSKKQCQQALWSSLYKQKLLLSVWRDG